jgi:hypothetical protein|tara:strand:- start:1448 stop:2428 length:981 start_codon:yes stop_codon:yes gene_type:complete
MSEIERLNRKWIGVGLFLVSLFITLSLLSTFALADTTNTGTTDNDQTNTSGSNTTISGGYSSESTTTYASGSTNDTSNTTTNTSNASKQNVPTASAPSMSAYSQDICATGKSGGLQLPGIGITGGSTSRDMNCERMKLSKLLNDYGMKVAAVAILCQDERVFEAMEQAGTPCPFEGKIGGAAVKQWKKYDNERPDYDKYVEKMDTRLKIDERIAKDEGTLEENESLKTDMKDVSKQNTELQKAIKELKEIQEQLIAAQQAEIERLENLIPDVVEVSEDEQASQWADSELDRIERQQQLQTEMIDLDATVEVSEDGRVKLTIPVNQR